MAEKDKRYYWLKLKRDFFKRHDIQIIESMPNGKDYILFYLKLLCESVDHDGNLRFNDEIPYNEEMLSTITRTNIDIVRSAIKVFTQLRMMELLDDGTYYMSEVNKMLGSETYWAQKKRESRGIKMLDNVQRESNELPTCPSKSIEIEKDIEIEKEKEKKPAAPDAFVAFANGNENLLEALKEFQKMRTKKKKPLTDRSKKLLCTSLAKLSSDPETQARIVDQSTERCWDGFYELKETKTNPRGPVTRTSVDDMGEMERRMVRRLMEKSHEIGD